MTQSSSNEKALTTYLRERRNKCAVVDHCDDSRIVQPVQRCGLRQSEDHPNSYTLNLLARWPVGSSSCAVPQRQLLYATICL